MGQVKDRKNGDELEKMVLDLKKKGYKHSEIAKKLNITIYQVNNISSLLKQEGETEDTGKTISSMKKLNRFKQIITRMKKYSNIQDAINYAKSWKNNIYLSNDERNKLKEFIIRAENHQKEEIIRLLKKGNTVEQVKAITKYSEGIIARIYRNYQKEQVDIEI